MCWPHGFLRITSWPSASAQSQAQSLTRLETVEHDHWIINTQAFSHVFTTTRSPGLALVAAFPFSTALASLAFLALDSATCGFFRQQQQPQQHLGLNSCGQCQDVSGHMDRSLMSGLSESKYLQRHRFLFRSISRLNLEPRCCIQLCLTSTSLESV